MNDTYSIGIDIGSTTAKVVVQNESGEMVYGKYQRHFADIRNTIQSMLAEVYEQFGCLPNHIAGKGIMKKVKELYPQANIVAIDYDPSASRVNQLNRIKLMMEVAERENCAE